LLNHTPGNLAANNGHLNVCQYIIDRNTYSKDGTTPLHWASRNGHFIDGVEQVQFQQTRMLDNVPTIFQQKYPKFGLLSRKVFVIREMKLDHSFSVFKSVKGG
jgi:hypothetical protein